MDHEFVGSKELNHMSCLQFAEFKEALKKLRTVDDKIIYNLNTSVPTASFQDKINAESQCKQLYQQLQDTYHIRDLAIRGCIQKISSDLEAMKNNKDDSDALKLLRSQQIA